jgi:histidinol-phosphate phosphatase family protein
MWKVDKDWSLFLDRDGVINVRIMDDYVKSPEEFVFLENVPESIAFFNTLFQHVFVVTNQQGIGKGTMTERNLLDVHHYMQESLRNFGAKITAFYYAPQLASENAEMRKPKPGMGLKAKAEFPTVDFSKSIMVGDSDSDIEFGKNLGMKTVKIDSELNDFSGADMCVRSLNEFKKLLIP